MSEPVGVYRVRVEGQDGSERFEVRRADNDEVIGYDTHFPDSEPTAEELARQSAVAKLQAIGLTEAEALALVGGF